MRDLTSPRLMALKAALFVTVGCLAGAAILIECPSLKVAGLLALVAWAFARAYYFAFYVVGKYVDPSFKFAGLGSVARYWWNRRRGTK